MAKGMGISVTTLRRIMNEIDIESHIKSYKGATRIEKMLPEVLSKFVEMYPEKIPVSIMAKKLGIATSTMKSIIRRHPDKFQKRRGYLEEITNPELLTRLNELVKKPISQLNISKSLNIPLTTMKAMIKRNNIVIEPLATRKLRTRIARNSLHA
jgi:hypothetical protein